MIAEGAHLVWQGELSELSLGLERTGKVRARLGVLAAEKCVYERRTGHATGPAGWRIDFRVTLEVNEDGVGQTQP